MKGVLPDLSEQTWKPQAYDQQLSFVSGYGKGLIEWLAPKPGEHILDLGCGTGDLAYEISASGARVTGMDASHEMIESAAAKYPSLTFIPEDGQNFTTATQYDAVFSNAALHWMRNAEGVIRSVHAALKPGGRLVAEFGGKGNVEGIYHAIRLVLLDSHGIDAATRNPWYYPSIGEYASLLEAHGFRVRMAYHSIVRPGYPEERTAFEFGCCILAIISSMDLLNNRKRMPSIASAISPNPRSGMRTVITLIINDCGSWRKSFRSLG